MFHLGILSLKLFVEVNDILNKDAIFLQYQFVDFCQPTPVLAPFLKLKTASGALPMH